MTLEELDERIKLGTGDLTVQELLERYLPSLAKALETGHDYVCLTDDYNQAVTRYEQAENNLDTLHGTLDVLTDRMTNLYSDVANTDALYDEMNAIRQAMIDR